MRVLGIDIGGTNIKFMLKENNNIIEEGEIPSRAKEGAEILLKVVFEICDKYTFNLLGVSTAGMIGDNGEIIYANENIPNYTGIKLKDILEKRYNVKVAVLNDIYASALSELSDSQQDYYFLAIGTSIGGAFVHNGQLIKGNNFAGQIGYLPSKDGTSIIDKTASVTGLKEITNISPKIIFDEIEKGNIMAKNGLKKWCDELIYLFTMVVGFFNPKKIVLSGGITREGEKLLKEIKKELYLLPEPYQNSFCLEIAKEDKFAGVVGAIKNVEKIYE